MGSRRCPNINNQQEVNIQNGPIEGTQLPKSAARGCGDVSSGNWARKSNRELHKAYAGCQGDLEVSVFVLQVKECTAVVDGTEVGTSCRDKVGVITG